MSREDKVAKLTEALHQLALAQSNVDNVLKDLMSSSSTSTSVLFPGHTYVVGDFVGIVNPGSDQDDKGHIVGRTGKGSNGFLKVKTPSGIIISRTPGKVFRIDQ